MASQSAHPQEIVEIAVEQHRRGNVSVARDLYECVLSKHPENIDANYLLGLTHLDESRCAEALPYIERAYSLARTNPLYAFNLGRALEGLGRIDEAIKKYREAILRRPDYSDALFRLAFVLQASGDYETALVAYRRLLTITPNQGSLHNNIANTLLSLGRLREAEVAMEKALALEPNFAEGYRNLGNILDAQGRWDDAETAVKTSITLAPDVAAGYYNLGNIQQRKFAYNHAAESYRKALERDPNLAAAHNNYGNLLKLLGRLQEAEIHLKSAIELIPGNAQSVSNLGTVYVSAGDIENAVSMFRKALELDPGYADAYSNLLYALNYPSDTDNELLFQEHLEWAIRFENPLLPDERPAAAGRKSGKLRIGYVSGDFRRHSVAFFFEPLLKHHDRSKFEIFCYSNVLTPDEITVRIRDACDHWRHITNVSDEQSAELIRNDRIDILIDLAGHTDRNRLLLFAHRPAPVQVSWLGYPNTTGLSSIDYRVTDEHADPVDEATDRLYSETLYRLKSCFLCYEGFELAPQPAPPPSLATSRITFGSFNNLTKLTRAVARLWSQLMHSIPESRLVLKTHQFADDGARKRTLELFQDHGIDSDRIELKGRIAGLKEHLAYYSNIDIALDTFPYNGTTTTCEALWMGVPVVTLAGDTHRNRVGRSILHHCGLEELIAYSEEAFLSTTKSLATDQDRLVSFRSTLRDRVGASILCDPEKFAKTMEAAYQEIGVT